MANIAIIGTGYVGLTTGACFAHLGHNVICADVIPDKVERLSRGEIPIFEAGLEGLVREGLQSGRLNFVLGAAKAVAESEFHYLCVPTPQGGDGSADLTYIESAAHEISALLASESVVVNKSTVPVGSTRRVEQALGRSDVYVVSNPEFLREGSAVNDFLNPDRIVIGSDDQGAAIRVASLYIGVPAPLMVTDPASAETIKYASNAFLATKLSFVNAVAAVCEAVGADVNDVVLGMGYDKRIGHEFLRPGPGWGGSCFVGEETVLVRRGDDVRLRTFEQLAVDIDQFGVEGYEVYAWAPAEPSPAFFPISAFTVRPYAGDILEVRTKMGRRVRVTPDHPFFVNDGVDGDRFEIRLAQDLTTSDWIPLAQDAPLPRDERIVVSTLDHLEEAGLDLTKLIGLFLSEGRLGSNCDTKRLPDLVWGLGVEEKQAILRGLWDGDGSWSVVSGGPSVVFEYGTVSRELADGMLRLLGDLGIVARLKVGRTAKSTVDTYRLIISGAGQVEQAAFLFPDDEQAQIRGWIAKQARRISPTGYRRLGKGAASVRVTSVTPVPFEGLVYSVEVPGAHTVVTTHGLIAHNCFPKDVQALLYIAREAGYHFDLLDGVVSANEEQFARTAGKVVAMAGGSVEGKVIGVWGLSFKANTDDLRQSPALQIVERLVAQGAVIKAYDPSVHGPLEQAPDVEIVGDAYAACDGAEVLTVLTEWDEFKWVDLDKVADLMVRPCIVDARNLLDRSVITRRGFIYQGVGRS